MDSCRTDRQRYGCRYDSDTDNKICDTGNSNTTVLFVDIDCSLNDIQYIYLHPFFITIY